MKRCLDLLMDGDRQNFKRAGKKVSIDERKKIYAEMAKDYMAELSAEHERILGEISYPLKAVEKVQGSAGEETLPLEEKINGIKPKEAWEMTKDEWLTQAKNLNKRYEEILREKIKDTGFERDANSPIYRIKSQEAIKQLKKEIGRIDIDFGTLGGYGHKAFVRQALSEGKPVPSEVLKDYPDLQSYPSKAVKTIQETAGGEAPTSAIKPLTVYRGVEGDISTKPLPAELDDILYHRIEKRLSDVNDIRGNSTGWKEIKSDAGTFLINPNTKEYIPFEVENKQRGGEVLRKRAEAQSFAMDNPLKKSPLPKGEIITKPLIEPSPKEALPSAISKTEETPIIHEDVKGKVISIEDKTGLIKAIDKAITEAPNIHPKYKLTKNDRGVWWIEEYNNEKGLYEFYRRQKTKTEGIENLNKLRADYGAYPDETPKIIFKKDNATYTIFNTKEALQEFKNKVIPKSVTLDFMGLQQSYEALAKSKTIQEGMTHLSEDAKYLRPLSMGDRNEDKIKELEEGIKRFGNKYIVDKYKEHFEKVQLMRKGELSPEEETALLGDIMFMSGSLTSVAGKTNQYMEAIGVKNPLKGLYQKLITKLPESVQEFLSPTSTVKNTKDFLYKRTLYKGGKSMKIERIGKKLEGWFKDFSQEDKEKIFDYMRGELSASELSAEALRKANQSRPILNMIGKMAVKEGFLDPKVYAKNKDTYIHYLYAKHILGEDVPIQISPSGRLNLGEFKGRIDKGIEDTQKLAEIEKYRKSIGLIQDPSIAIPTGVTKTLSDVYKNRFYTEIANNPDWTWQPSKIKIGGKAYNPVELSDEVKTAKAVADYAKTPETIERYNTLNNALQESMEQTRNMPKGFVKVPDSEGWGALKGLAIRKPIYDDLAPLFESKIEDMGNIAKTLYHIERKSIVAFKMLKVGVNPPSMARNTVSNVVQLNMSGMNLPEIASDIPKALTGMLKRSPEYIRAERSGLFRTNWSVTEIQELLEGIKGAKGFDIFGKIESMAKFYGKIDDLFKFVKYRDVIAKGGSKQDAVLEALKWGMDYSLASRSVKTLRRHAIPFLSYQYKIAPLIAETAIERPWVIAKYMALPAMAMEYVKRSQNWTDEDVKRLERELPVYIKRSNSYMVMPFKDKGEKPTWVNLKYFFPWGDYSEKAQMLNQKEFTEAIRGDISTPAINIITAVITKAIDKPPKDPYSGREIYNRFDKPADKMGKLMGWLYNLHAPSFATIENPLSAKNFLSDYGAGGYTQRYMTGEKDRYGRKVTGGQAFGRWFGVNIIEPSPKQTSIIKQAQLKELDAGIYRALSRPDLSSQERKEKINEYREQKKRILTGKIEKMIDTQKIKEAITGNN